ncbi:MAG TPA: hypothetical protein VJ438_01235, partial [Candidatus Nanoarchaeia archaeon]|nr:hypothetical protein [Candidatus Nanoarchaeia archaeon]
MTNQFNSNSIFEYNYGKKIRFIIYLCLAIILIAGFCGYYYFFLSKMDNFFVNTINAVILHITSNLANTGSYLGAFYTTAIGGLFFIPVPIELTFLASLKAGIPAILLILIYMIGLIIGYTINYKIGSVFSELSKKLITPRKFYKIKVSVNKYGMLTVFLFNLLPLPAQPLSA